MTMGLNQTGYDPAPRLALFKALCAARAAIAGTVYKAGDKTGAGGTYRYVGHEHVVLHVRAAMLEHGLMLLENKLQWVGVISMGQGKSDLNHWRGHLELVHVEGGSMGYVFECFTASGDKAAFIASTALDRTALLRIMGVAGSAEEDPEHNSNDRPEPRAPARERAEQGQAARQANANEVQAELTRIVAGLPQLQQVDQLVEWAGWLQHLPFDKGAKTAAWQAFAAKCENLGVAPKDLAPAFMARSRELRSAAGAP